ncbi:PREDICTED: IgG receptor FcRn large subunit p51 [Myotis brandtii]|uniref:IgG receptor FcRn large subunit p51 n=1 Tax=Myotis brandtii TaxID=109478 RepID=UPI000703D479|nr:PREDICTED: IgG receptor FcRn large subunit p51 [Myotis brandtii]
MGTRSRLLSCLWVKTALGERDRGSPAFWATGWLGPQQYLRYSDLRGQAEPFGAWIWESQLPWYWEKETADLRVKQALFLEAFTVLDEGGSYVLQGLLGCEMGPDNSTAAVATFALNGEEFMKFDPKAGNWDGDWPEARAISQKWRQHEDAVWQEGHFLLTSCPQRLLGHLETGRSNLEWKGERPPEESDPGSASPRPHLRPHPPPTASSLASHLAVGLGEVPRDSSAKSLVPVVGIVIGFLLLMAVAAGGAVLWWRMKRGLPAPWILLRGDDLGALLPTGPSKDADS